VILASGLFFTLDPKSTFFLSILREKSLSDRSLQQI
jgi:hypothetical protein